MQCQIRGMGEASETARPPHDTLPRSGRVNEVCREWLVHEDGALAYRLQKEEVDQHLSGNKTRNAVVRQDTPIAKWEQKREEEEAISRQIEERVMQEALDSSVAQKLAERLEREEERRRQARLQRDAEIARRLYEREHGPHNNIGLPASPEYQMRRLEISRPVSSPSPYVVAANAVEAEEEARRHQEEKDAELARQLQEEEECVPDRLLAIEAQDEELARMLQEKERAKLRRAKERAKQKALLKKQQMLQQQHNDDADEDDENCYSLPHAAAESLESLPARSPPARSPAPKINKRFPDPEAIEVILPSGDIVPVSPSSVDSARNIAAVIDPTYPRKQSQSRPREASSAVATAAAAAATAAATAATTAASVLPSSPSTPTAMMAGLVETDTTPTPPYMPVQGQRRISSLEKKKKSKSKDACRQQ